MAHATEFKITTDDPSIDFNDIDKKVAIVIEKQEAIKKQFSKSTISFDERKEIISEILTNDKKTFKDLDFDLFYQDLTHYNNGKLKTKYSFLSDKTIKRLKLALEIK